MDSKSNESKDTADLPLPVQIALQSSHFEAEGEEEEAETEVDNTGRAISDHVQDSREVHEGLELQAKDTADLPPAIQIAFQSSHFEEEEEKVEEGAPREHDEMGGRGELSDEAHEALESQPSAASELHLEPVESMATQDLPVRLSLIHSRRPAQAPPPVPLAETPSVPVVEAQPINSSELEHDGGGGGQFIYSPDGSPNIPESSVKCKRWYVLASAGLLIAVVAVAIAVPVALSPNNGHESSVATMAKCFETTVELHRAVNDYLQDSGSDTSVARTYGWPINEWCVGQISNFVQLFSVIRNPLAAEFNDQVGSWNTSQATDMHQMFQGAVAFNQDVSSWDVRQVVRMTEMFLGAASFNQDVGSWNTSQATDMSKMFRGAISFNQDVSFWDVRQVVRMTEMFLAAASFNQDLCAWQPVLMNATALVRDMFLETSCEVTSDPVLSSAEYPDGSFCTICVAPSSSPSVSHAPSSAPTASPSTTQPPQTEPPTDSPTASFSPTGVPTLSFRPTLTFEPSNGPTVSSHPTFTGNSTASQGFRQGFIVPDATTTFTEEQFVQIGELFAGHTEQFEPSNAIGLVDTVCTVDTNVEEQAIIEDKVNFPDGGVLVNSLDYTCEYTSRHVNVETYPTLFQTYMNENLANVTLDMQELGIPVNEALVANVANRVTPAPTVSLMPSQSPSLRPSFSAQPSHGPSSQPTLNPTTSSKPTMTPSSAPSTSIAPSAGLSSQPTNIYTTKVNNRNVPAIVAGTVGGGIALLAGLAYVFKRQKQRRQRTLP